MAIFSIICRILNYYNTYISVAVEVLLREKYAFAQKWNIPSLAFLYQFSAYDVITNAEICFLLSPWYSMGVLSSHLSDFRSSARIYTSPIGISRNSRSESISKSFIKLRNPCIPNIQNIFPWYLLSTSSHHQTLYIKLHIHNTLVYKVKSKAKRELYGFKDTI